MINNITKAEITKAAEFAEAAYGQKISGAFKYESKIGACVFLKRTSDAQYIIWRGTNSPIDWLANLTCIPWRVAGKWVHGGFAFQQNSVWKPVRKQLDPSKLTYCIGHSLGGAAATISAAKLVRSNFKSVKLITMGRPNVWFRSKTDLGADCNVSIVSGSDIVCTVPRTFGSANDQSIIFMANDSMDYLNPDKEFRRADRLQHLKDSVSDHLMDTSYLPRIKKLKLEKLCESPS